MSPAKQKLKVTPELCEGCRPGHYDCERACKQRAIRVGKGFVYVDWERCDGCLACVDMCETGALQPRGSANAGGAGGTAAGAARAASPTRATQNSARAGGAPAQPRSQVSRDGNGSNGPGAIWTETDGLIALLVMLGSLFALNAALDHRIVALMPPSGRVIARAGGLAISYGVELVLIWFLARRHGVGLGKAFGLRPVFRSFRSTVTSALLVVGLLVGARIVTTAYGLITQALEWEPVFQWDTDLTKLFGGGQTGLALTVILVVIFGPFVEELVFRGVVQSSFRRRWRLGPSILATSALFAVYHFDPWMFAPTFVLGLALGWLAENRQGLWPPIALHILYNAITVFAVFWLAAQ